eukprot:6175190-Pleurochrysis_carterae.AAC.2
MPPRSILHSRDPSKSIPKSEICGSQPIPVTSSLPKSNLLCSTIRRQVYSHGKYTSSGGELARRRARQELVGRNCGVSESGKTEEEATSVHAHTYDSVPPK